MHSCGERCPDLEVGCDSRPHGPGVAHHASGTAGDGTRWSLFWWQPGEVAEQPVAVTAAPVRSPGAAGRLAVTGDG
jgi:hypothetical protein